MSPTWPWSTKASRGALGHGVDRVGRRKRSQPRGHEPRVPKDSQQLLQRLLLSPVRGDVWSIAAVASSVLLTAETGVIPVAVNTANGGRAHESPPAFRAAQRSRE